MDTDGTGLPLIEGTVFLEGLKKTTEDLNVVGVPAGHATEAVPLDPTCPDFLFLTI
jgi:hypothetical protein